MFGLGMQELIIVAVIVLILFGSRLPSVMRNLGSGVKEFKKGIRDDVDGDDEYASKPAKDYDPKPTKEREEV